MYGNDSMAEEMLVLLRDRPPTDIEVEEELYCMVRAVRDLGAISAPSRRRVEAAHLGGASPRRCSRAASSDSLAEAHRPDRAPRRPHPSLAAAYSRRRSGRSRRRRDGWRTAPRARRRKQQQQQ